MQLIEVSLSSVEKSTKICHVTRSDNSVKMLLLNQLNSLKDEGYQISVACTPEGGWFEEIESAGFAAKQLAVKSAITPFADLKTLVTLFFHFRRERFHIVHAHTPKIGFLGQLAHQVEDLGENDYADRQED